MNKEKAACCGYGGLVEYTNRPLASSAAEKRVKQAEGNIAVYCAVCRDRFIAAGAKAKHIVEILFGESESRALTFNQRQKGRVIFKERALKEIWGEEKMKDPNEIILKISPEIEALMQDRMIVETDLKSAVNKGERDGKKFFNPKTGRYIASYRAGAVTYWVEYTPEDDGYRVHTAYSHRLLIKGTE